MDGLRWLLLGLGLLLILGVYLYSRRNASGKEVSGTGEARREPTLQPGEDAEPGWDDSEYSLTGYDPDAVAIREDEGDIAAGPVADEAEEEREPLPQKIVTLRIIAHGGGTFRGGDLILNLRGIGMRHGKFGIFHRYDGDNENEPVFSAASLIEPGSFDLANIAEQEIPGISLFAVLPGPLDGVEAFDMLMSAARTLAQSLDGELLDESGSTLSIQRERYMREEIVQYQHGHQVA